MYSEKSKKGICLDSFSKQIFFRLISVFETTALLNLPINSISLRLLLSSLIGSMMRVL